MPVSKPRIARAAPKVERDTRDATMPTASWEKRRAASAQKPNPRTDTATKPTRTQTPCRVTEAISDSPAKLLRAQAKPRVMAGTAMIGDRESIRLSGRDDDDRYRFRASWPRRF